MGVGVCFLIVPGIRTSDLEGRKWGVGGGKDGVPFGLEPRQEIGTIWGTVSLCAQSTALTHGRMLNG